MPRHFNWKTYATKLNSVEALLDRRRDSHRAKFLQLMIEKGGVGAELGVYKGRFTRVILDVVAPERLHLVDLWYLTGERWDWAYGNQSTIDALTRILRKYAAELISGRAILHVGDDLEVLRTFPDRYFDWVYLDTSHNYGHSVEELQILDLKVKVGGVIAGDDWQTDPAHVHHGVCRAVREFVAREPYELLYANDVDKQWAIRSRAKRFTDASGN
jgi:Methyltransferase domain